MLTAAGSALVAGNHEETTMTKKIKVEVVRPFLVDGVRKEVGEIFDYVEHLAVEAISMGKAKRPPEPVEPSPAEVLSDEEKQVLADEQAAEARAHKGKGKK